MKKKPEQPRRTCGECEHGKPDYKFENLSLEGKPTLVRCPFSFYAHTMNEKAYNLFKSK